MLFLGMRRLMGWGCIEEARELIDRMSEKNVVSWNCLIDGHVSEIGVVGGG